MPTSPPPEARNRCQGEDKKKKSKGKKIQATFTRVKAPVLNADDEETVEPEDEAMSDGEDEAEDTGAHESDDEEMCAS